MIVVRQALVFLVAGSLGYAGAASGQALSAGDPPGRVGRLAFLQGTVSFHDSNRTDWAPAMVNTPITTGDAIWTEPNAHSEISIAGTRVRLDSATQLDMLALDDTQTRMQIDQGRVDIKTFTYDTRQPYEIVTPRGVVSLQQQGDYYVEAGSTQDPTRLGVRQGAAQFQTPNGQVLAVQAGQVAEVTGDGNAIQLHTIQAPPPPMPTYWAQRDRVVVYEQPPQYLSASVTGYEDLNYYGSWTNDPEYGQVWYARSVPQGWAPYTSGRWISDPMYGWTWVDEQPWGFAPYHYGRWAQRNNRWFWVPPERTQRAVYAPALVAFVGGTELGMALGMQNRQPVGWFPLGPREAYVPSYTSNRDYYRRLNLTARVQERALEDRWERAQRRETIQQAMLNRRFTTVVPADDFARSRPVNRTAIQFAPERLASVPVAAVAAPPQPNQSIRALQAPVNDRDARGRDDRNDRTDRPNDRDGRPGMAGVAAGAAGVAGAAALMAIKPEPERQRAPGPQIATRPAATAPTADQKPALPQLAPRNASAPPPAQIQGDRRPAITQPGSQQAIAPATPGQPGAATPPPSPPQATAPATRPADSDRARPGEPPRPGQANLPPVRDRNDQRPEPPRPGEPPKPPQAQAAPGAQQTTPQPPRPGEPPKSPQAQTAPGAQQATPQPPRPGEPPKSPQAQTAPGAQQAAPQPPRPGEPPKPPQAQNAPGAQQATPQPHRQAEPPKPPQAQTPPRPPQQATPPAPPPQQQIQRQPMPQHQPAPPQQQIQRQPMPQHQPAPPQQQVQVPRPQPAPPPQAQAPHPQQVQAPPRPQPAPPPPQAQAPRPQPAPPPQAQAPRQQPTPPPQAQAPRQQPAPPQQAQAPRPQPAPPAQQTQQKPPQPQQPGQQKQDDKK